MRFRTLWFSNISHTYTLREKLLRSRDIAASRVAKALPVRVKYWVTLQEIGHATRDSCDVPAASVSYVLAHLRTPKTLG